MENARKILEEIQCILLNQNYVFSIKQKYIERAINIIKKIIDMESIEDFFNSNDNDIKFFFSPFLKDIIRESLSQHYGEEGNDYYFLLIIYIDFFCVFYNHKDYGQILQSYLIEIFDAEKPVYSSFQETYEKYNEFLPKNPAKFCEFQLGDDVDVLIPQNNFDNGNWVRGKIKEIIEDENGDVFYDINTSDDKKYFQFKKDSINIQKVGTMTSDWDWRISLKERDIIDVMDRGEWYPATVIQIQKHIINGIIKVNYKIGFRLFVNDFPEWSDYSLFWKGKMLSNDQKGNVYLGDSFSFDKVIPHYSRRIQKFKSCIFTQSLPDKRVKIDDFYLYNDPQDNHKKHRIIGRNYKTFKYGYALLLKEFYENGGYDIILYMFDCEKDNNHSSSSNLIYAGLYILVGSLCYFHKDFFEEVSEGLISKYYDYFNNADIKTMRNIRKETIDLMIQVVSFFEKSKSNPNNVLLNKFFLLMIIRLFKTNIFDKKLLGVKILNDYINSISNQIEQIYQFIQENNIINEIFGPEGHEQFVSKGIGIIEALIKHNLFQENDLEKLWSSTQKGNVESKLSVIKLIKDHMSKINEGLIIIIIEKINAQLKENLLIEEIELLFQIAISFPFDVNDHIGLYINDYLIKYVSINEEDKFKKIAEMVIKLMHKNKKFEAYFEYFLKEIKAYTYSANVLKYLLFSFEKFGICIKKSIKEYSQGNIIDFMNDDYTPTLTNSNLLSMSNSGNKQINSTDNQALISAVNDKLIANNVLLGLYEDNFKLFKLNYFNTLNANNNIQNELEIRIDFVSILNMYHPAFDSLSFLSSILISEPSDPQWQRSLFTFIKKNLESSETTSNVIFALFINKTIDFPALRLDNQIIAYEIFNEAFLSENMKKKNLVYFPNEKNDDAIPSYDIRLLSSPQNLIGFEHLWNIIFDSKASCVLNHGMKSIYSLYCNFIDELISKIFNQLNERTKVIQMISFMTYIMKESEKTVMSLIASHKSILMSQKIMLYIISSTGRESYYLYSNITLYNFKLLLCHKRSCSIDHIILSHRGSQLRDIDHIKTLSELGFQSNDDISFTTIVDIAQKPLIINCQMSPDYEKIINSWFSIFSSEEKMDAESLAQFTSISTGKQIHFEPDDAMIKEILLHYDAGNKGHLTREEFNKLYFEKAIQIPHLVYNSLNLMGIRNDLKEINEAVVINIIPKEKVIRYKISNDSNWISLLFNILKEDNSIELFDFIFSLCTNNDIYNLISNGKITEEIISNKYLMVYCLYIIESYLSKDNQYTNIKERDDNEILKLHPEFNMTINATAFFNSLIKEHSHIALFTYYTQHEYDLTVYCDRLLIEHLTKVITKILMKQSAIDYYDTTLLFNKQLNLLIKGSKESEIELEESLMMNGFDLIMHLLVFKLRNITEIIIENKQTLRNFIMNGLINKSPNLKKYFGENLIKYTQLSEKTNKQVIVSFLFECCFNIFHKLKTENNFNDLSFFFEYFTSMFEHYSSDDNHFSFINEIIQEIKTNQDIPNEILIGYIKILTKSIKSIHNNDETNANTNFLMKYVMDNIIFQKISPQLMKVSSMASDYIKPIDYSEAKESNKNKKDNNNILLQSAFNYIKQVFKHINRKEDIGMIEEFFNQKESYEQSFNPKTATANNNNTNYHHYQATGNSNSNINIIKRRNNNHCGLDNLGFTCYMNSAIQQLFYIDTFKNAILQSPLVKDSDDNSKASENTNTNIMYQLKKLFSYLDISIRSSYDPKGFVSSLNAIMNNGLNAIGQQDSQEFLNSFFDVIEKKIKSSKYKYIIDRTFIGKICSMIICDSCHHTSLRFENFYTLSLDVSNMKTLSNSLEKFISYELIDEFKCEGCNQKVQIKKRNLLCDLPNILIIHLKRFNMNYETCLTEKLNTRLEFPFSLLMDKYCVEAIGGPLNNDEIYLKKEECYIYSLIGVIVHNGTAEEGHYFSIINNKSEKKWIKVNDSEVSDFDISKLSSECFGESNCNIEDDFNDGNWLFDNNNNNNFLDDDDNTSKQNAYLLFYEKKRKSDIIIVKEDNTTIESFDNPLDPSIEIIQLNEGNTKELLRKFDKDRIDYDIDLDLDSVDQNNNKKYFYCEKTKELYYYSPFDSVEYLIPKDIYIEILKDNFPLEKCICYYEENYNEFYTKVFKVIQSKTIEINLDDYGDRWLKVILMIIFVNQNMITANQLKVLNKFLNTHYEMILDNFANKCSIEALFITDKTESIEFLVSLLIDLIQYSFDQIDSKAYNDSINIVYQIISLFPKINFHYVNKIYPLYNLFYSLVQSNDFWIKMFLENNFIKVILAYIMGKDSRLFYEFTAVNDHWDATRPSSLININQLFSFLHFIIKKTSIFQKHKFINRLPNKTILDSEKESTSFDFPLKDLKMFSEDSVMRMICSSNFDLFRDLNIMLQYDDKEDSFTLSNELCHLLFKTMNSDEKQLSQLMDLIFDVISMNDQYQLMRLQIIFGYQSVLISQAKALHGIPLLGMQIKKRWIHFLSNQPLKCSNLIRKILCFPSQKQIKYIFQLLYLVNTKENTITEEEGNNNDDGNDNANDYDQSVLFAYLFNNKSPNYSQPQFISYLLDYLSNLINIELDSDEKDDNINALSLLTKDINALISAYPSDIKCNKYIPDKVKYEEISIECQGREMFVFKTKYYTSVYPSDNDKLDMIKDTYPFIKLDYNNTSNNISILDVIDREASDKIFYKKIIPILTSSNKVIVVSQEDIPYPLLTVVRYGIYNNHDCESEVSTKITLKDTSRKFIETRLPETINLSVAPKEYKEVFVINKNDYFDENNSIDDITIKIQLEWKHASYFHQRNTGE